MNNKNVLSLFSSAGIGELGIQAAGLKILVSNELLQNRCDLYRENYPDVKMICGDIWKKENEIVTRWRKETSECPFLIYATPPCQGMSSNGAGKLLSGIRNGVRKKEDPRNRLIIPTVHIIKKLNPRWVMLENVPNMKNTVIRDEDGKYMRLRA